MSLFARFFRPSKQAEIARLREQLQAAAALLSDAREHHAATIAAIQQDIRAELNAAPECAHNIRPSCGRCQYRQGLAKALELAREAAGLS